MFGPLVRPEIVGDECELGYLNRVASANGLKNPSMPIFRQLYKDLGLSTAGFRLTDAELFFNSNSLALEHLQAWGYAKLGSSCIPSKVIRKDRFGLQPICRECLKDKFYLRAAWQLRCFEVCPIHDRSLEVVYVGFKRGTKQDIWSGKVVSLRPLNKVQDFDDDELRLSKKTLSYFQSNSSQLVDLDVATGIFLISLIEAMVYVNRALLRSGKSRLFARGARWQRLFGLVFPDALDGIGRFLKDLRIRGHRWAARRMLETMIDAESRKSTVLSCLPLKSWIQYFSDELEPEVGTYAHVRDDNLLTNALNESERIFSEKLVGYLHNSKKIEDGERVVLKCGKRYTVIDASNLHDFSHISHKSHGRWATIKALNMAGKKESLKQLRRAGIIHFEDGSRSRYQKNSIDDLLSMLKSHVAGYVSTAARSISLADPFLYRYCHLKALYELIQDIANFKIEVSYDPCKQGLEAFCVPLTVLERLRQRSNAFAESKRKPTHIGQLRLFDAS